MNDDEEKDIFKESELQAKHLSSLLNYLHISLKNMNSFLHTGGLSLLIIIDI